MDKKQLEGLKILILDDNRNFLAIMRQILRALGVRKIIDASNAESAFEILRNTNIDMAFIDLRMPGLDGFEFTKLVRNSSDSPNRFLPIVMVTADARQSVVKESINAGVEEFLIKPVRPRDVYLRIMRLINHPHTYVRTKSYFGPDRRRRDDMTRQGIDRRIAPNNACYVANPHKIAKSDSLLAPKKSRVKHSGKLDNPRLKSVMQRPEESDDDNLMFL